MADNPFDLKNFGLFGALGGPPKGNALSDISPAAAEISPLARAIADLLTEQPPTPGLLGGAVNDLFLPPAPTPSPYSLGSLAAIADLLPPPTHSYSGALSDFLGSPTPAPRNGLSAAASDLFPAPLAPQTPSKATVKRRAFFSFHYDDIMRVNVVRNAWKIDHPDNVLMRSFQDSSLWESRKLEGDEAIKRLIREGVEYTSAVCVLIGSDTWLRQWVRYEIARAIIDGRGLLGVHLNSIRHHHTKTPHTRGNNPLDFMAVGKVQDNALQTARYYLFEKHAVPDGSGGYRWGWIRYSDYTSAVTLPSWLADPRAGHVTPLSWNASVYDYTADDGHKNIGSWIDRAAQGAGR